MSKKLILIAFVVSLGGFLFGFDAGIISGVMSYAGPEFNLNDIQSGWVVSSPSFAAMIAMIFRDFKSIIFCNMIACLINSYSLIVDIRCDGLGL